MSCPTPKLIVGFICCILITGCQPHRPAYRFDRGDLNFYVDQATEIAYPDVETAILDEVTHSYPPITNSEAQFESFWDLSLEDATAIALQNSKVIRGYGTPGLQGIRVAPGVDNLANGPGGAGTIYNVAIRETEPGIIGLPGQIPAVASLLTNTALDANQGVEAALADFDAQLTSNVSWNRTNRRNNNNFVLDPNNPNNDQGFFGLFNDQHGVNWSTQLAKRAANGSQLIARTVNSYTRDKFPPTAQALASVWQTALEMEIRQPLLRGRGTFINRMPVVISRINTDQQIANFEATIQNMATNIEIRYWDLHCGYRNLETAKAGRDAALDTWRTVNENFKAGKVPLQDESQARGQYFFFRGLVEQSWADLLIAEGNLRYLMGVAATDGRLIRPVNEPTKARIAFDWHQSMDEALVYRPELRQERWEIQKRELALAYSKNSLLPQLNVSGLYRWLGLGDQFANYGAGTPDFPNPGSGALNEFASGNYQEFQVAMDFAMPVGFRRELSNVRNAQLKLAQELARLEDMELDVSREMTQALQALEAQYQIAQTNFNSWAAYTSELEARQERYEAGSDPITFLLDAQRSRAQGENAYYQAICEYNKLIALIHRRKGTILAYNNIGMGEGPWPDKAYDDASENARRRGASRQINYGFTRPQVISQGPIYPTAGDTGGAEYPLPAEYPAIESYRAAPEVIEGMPIEEIPGQPTPAEGFDALPDPAGNPTSPGAEPQPGLGTLGANASPSSPGSTRVDWQRFGFTRPDESAPTTRAVIRQVNYEEQQ